MVFRLISYWRRLGVGDPTDNMLPAEIVPIVEEIHKRVVWLEPIDMEPTPKNWNMLPAILARIEQAYNQYCKTSKEDESYQSNYSGLLDPSRDYHDAMKELQQLQNNVALSWDGNLNERAAQLDPDSYALETMRIEKARLELNPNVKKVLDSIAYAISHSSTIENPLFILPIDDFDLNPVISLELLRILRMLSVPRLFTFMLGDLEMVDVVLNLKISNDLNSLCPQIREEMLSITSSYVAMTAGRITADSIHKLLPPMQCIQLQPMHSFEALNFCPLGELTKSEEPFLYHKLERCPMKFGDHIKEDAELNPPYGIKFISEFLVAKGLPVISAPHKDKILQCEPSKSKLGKKRYKAEDIVNQAFYSGTLMMNTVPRYVIDIWFTFNRFIDYSVSKKAKESTIVEKWTTEVKLVAELCQNILLRDGALDPVTRSHTRSGFFNEHIGGWDLEALPVTTRSVLDNGKIISNLQNTFVQDSDKANLTCHFNSFKALGWRFQLISKAKNAPPSELVFGSNPRKTSEPDGRVNDVQEAKYVQLGKDLVSGDHLGTDTSGALILFHDLLALGPTYRSHSFLLKPGIKHVTDKAWCLTTWQMGIARKVELAWYRPRCPSFWGLDLFRYAWNDLLQNGKIEKTPENLTFTWISAGTGVTLVEPPITIKNEMPVPSDWKEIGERLNLLAQKILNGGLMDEQAQSWLIGIALMIMPETGLPNIPNLYSGQKHLTAFWKFHARSIRDYRYERLTKIYKAGMEKLAIEFYDGIPDGFRDSESVKIRNVKNINDINQFRPHKFNKFVKSKEVI